MSLQVKTKAIKLILSDDVTAVYVHSPSTEDLPTFLRGMPALSAMATLLKSVDRETAEAGAVPVKDEDLEAVYPLLTSMVEYEDEAGVMQPLTIEDFKALPVWDGIMVLQAFTSFVPKNLSPSPVLLEPQSSIVKG